MPRLSHQLVLRARELIAATRAGPGAVAAAAELASFRDSLRVLDLRYLDSELRQDRFETHHGWDVIKPTDLRQISALPQGSAVLQFLTCHPSGWVREAAIRELAVASDGAEVVFLLLRVNDWVEPVRRAAVAGLRARVGSGFAHALVPALPLLERMRGWQRIDERGLLDQLEAMMGPAELGAGLASTDVLVRRSCARRLVTGTPEDAAIDLALADRDSVTRRTIARWLCVEAGPRFDARAPLLLRDRLATIRREALAVGLTRGVSAETHLVDPDPRVRGLAQAHLVAAGEDVASRYRAMLEHTSAPIRAIGLTGLAESAGDGATDGVRRHLDDPQARLRVAALTAAAILRLPDLHELLIAALADPAPSARRLARDLLIVRAMRLQPAAVWAAFTVAPRGQGQRAALAVLSRCDFWPRISYLLRATADPDPEVHSLAQAYVASWLARRERVFTSPSAAHVGAILASLAIAQVETAVAREIASVATRASTPATSPS